MYLARLIPIAALIAVAQEPLRVDLRLVEAHVVAYDSRGAVGDLKESDFKLFDNGKEQRIAVFKVSKAALPAAKPPMPGVFSNRYKTTASPVTSATVLLIDTLNTEVADQRYAQKQILEMLGSLDLKEPLALYVLEDKLTVLQDFTLDVEALRKAMAAWRPIASQTLSTSQTPTPRRAGRGGAEATAVHGFEDIREFSLQERATETMDAFEWIAQKLMGVPGRKNVVWISSGFPPRFLKGSWERLRALNQADIAIYPVDARGLLVNGRLSPSADTLAEVADQTGGQVFPNTNDLAGALGKATEDAQVSYTLGFYASNEKPDGQYHELRVKTDRRGVDLRYRKGYFDEPSASGTLNTSAILRHAADEPLDASGIGLVAAVGRSQDSKYRVAVLVDLRDLLLGRQDGHWKGGADLALVSQRADGTTLGIVDKSITFDMADDVYAKRQSEGFTIEEDIPASKDLSRIRVVIVDRSTGVVGSVSAMVAGR